MNKREFIGILDILEKHVNYIDLQSYRRPDHPLEERRGDLFECLISIILSQRTTFSAEIGVEAELFEQYKTPSDFVKVPEELLEKIINPVGFQKKKTMVIKTIARKILDEYKGNLNFLRNLPTEEAKKILLSMDGVGEKTTDCFLLWGLGRYSLPIDTNVYRVSRKMGIVSEESSLRDVKQALEQLLKPDITMYRRAHTYLIGLGKYFCKPKPICEGCPVDRYCKFFNESLR